MSKVQSIYWDREGFYNYMTSKKKITPKVASDYLSRCMRLINDFKVNLDTASKNKENYIDTVYKIHNEILKMDISVSTQRSLCGTLRLALRTYGEHKWGLKVSSTYPRLYLIFQTQS